MYNTAQSIHSVYSVFGAGFVPEHHVDNEQRKLAPLDDERRFVDFAKALTGLVWGSTINH